MTVTYTAGYTEETIPSDLKYAIYDIANKIANAGDSWNSNVSKEHIDGASIEWKSLDIMNSMNIILSYKKVAV